MTSIDWFIVGFTMLMGLWGYAQGLIVGALSLAGFGVGAFVGSRVAPLLLEEGSRSPYAPLLALVGALVVGGFLASGLEVVGLRLRSGLDERLGVLDGLGGSAVVACVGLGIAWLIGAVALQTPGARQLREPFQRSVILQRLNAVLPPSGPILRALARFDPLPRITGPQPGVNPPNPLIVRDPEIRAAGASVVKVLGTACGLGVEGSGWVARPGVVVTNAHVVAGQDDTTVQLQGQGPQLDSQAIWYDSRNDVAVLRVPALAAVRPLALNVSAPVGTSGAILGFPENGPYDVEAGRLGRTGTVVTDDAYGRGPVRRRITAVRGLIRHGNSGGPMVDGEGRVVTTIFAATVGGGGEGGFGVPDTLVQAALARASGPVDTGPCAR